MISPGHGFYSVHIDMNYFFRINQRRFSSKRTHQLIILATKEQSIKPDQTDQILIKMGKGNKKNKKEEIPEEPVAPVDPYAHVQGPERDFIIKILKRIDKAPRVKVKYQAIVEAVEKRKKELEEKGETVDPLIDLLLKQVDEFSNSKDPRMQAEFNNYDNKFALELD